MEGKIYPKYNENLRENHELNLNPKLQTNQPSNTIYPVHVLLYYNSPYDNCSSMVITVDVILTF